MNYQEFIKTKIHFNNKTGFVIEDGEISETLFPHQREIVKWAIRGGKRAIFAAFGLGKSIMQLEILRIIHNHEGGRNLIVAPLGVRQEFKRDAELVGIDNLKFIRRTDELDSDGFYITNYESIRDGKLDVTLFNCVTLVY